jgi:hypothetical protein
MSSCEKSKSSIPTAIGEGNNIILLGENCGKISAGGIENGLIKIIQNYNISDKSNYTVNTEISHYKQECLDCDLKEGTSIAFLTIVNENNIGIQLARPNKQLTIFDEQLPSQITTGLYDITITSSFYDVSGKFQVQVYILYKENYISVNKGDVFVINYMYDPTNTLFTTSVQYQPVKLEKVNTKVFQEVSFNNVRRNKLCQARYDNHYIKYSNVIHLQ